jgi:hypothetical protein
MQASQDHCKLQLISLVIKELILRTPYFNGTSTQPKLCSHSIMFWLIFMHKIMARNEHLNMPVKWNRDKQYYADKNYVYLLLPSLD